MKCFVIMPFGEKLDADGKPIDFDTVYNYLIKPAVETMPQISCLRCDEIDEAGWIHSKMFSQVYESDVAVVDITSLNPNVFYELGIRHALVPRVTVLLKRRGTPIPFNIQGLKVIEYDVTDPKSVHDTKESLAEHIRNGLAGAYQDSPVHNILGLNVHRQAIRIAQQDIFEYKHKKSGTHLCVVTGEIQNMRKLADVWVSSENVNMQMARHFDKSVSAVIRYLGAKRNVGGEVVDDLVYDDLRRTVGNVHSVTPGAVIVTSAGELEKSHGVKKIFHAAAVVGMFGEGFRPIPHIGACVRRSLELMDDDVLSDADLKTILFPMMGTGDGRGGVEEAAQTLIDCAIAYLELNWATTRVQRIYFVALTQRDLEACQRVLNRATKVAAVAQAP